METVPISQFKARCHAILARVKRTGRPVVVTRFGKPMVKVVPPTTSMRSKHWLGSLRGTARIVGDIVSPASKESDWEVLRK
jgi:prevent-host-death family protein